MFRPFIAITLLLTLVSGLQATPQSGDFPDLKSEVDQSVRWLRARQNPVDGSYGEGVEATSWALFALARSPRSYTVQDGPFISKAVAFVLGRQGSDGSIADADADPAARLRQTRAAAAALSVHLSPATAKGLGQAARWLGAQDGAVAGLSEIQLPEDEPGARKLAIRLLAARSPAGAFPGAEGEIVETARAITALSAIRRMLTPPPVKATNIVPLPASKGATPAELDAAVLRGARALMALGPDARWGAPGRPDAGLTAMAVAGLQAVPSPRPKPIQAAIDSALAWLVSFQKEDGSIHQGRLANYVTSASIMALAEAPQYAGQVKRARDWIVRLQADEGEGYSEGDIYYGGIGYGGDERPDLSNLQMALEALVAAGTPSDHEAMQRSLKFLERCQNRSESNDVEVTRDGIVIKSGDDGGAGYAPGDSKAGFVTLDDGSRVPISYGSMTYALLKGFVFAGLSKDDPRVKQAWAWLSANYTLDVNPGFDASKDPLAPYQGLFYYFHTMAKALDAYGEDAVVDASGTSHAWRAELAGRLISLQSKADGTWINANAPRWWEGNPVLATAYALQSLSACRK